MLKHRIKNGEFVIGTWCNIPSPSVCNIIAKAGLDFLIIDMEHGPIDFKVAQEMVMATEADHCEALVRVPENSESPVLKALDLGASGLVVPHVKSFQDINKLVSFAKFQPVGGRSYNPYIRAMGYSLTTDIQEKNNSIVLAVMLEDVESVKNLEEITENRGIDVVYLGIYDLAVSMGLGNDIGNKQVRSLVDQAVKRIINSGKAPGCMVHNAEEIEYCKKLGISFLVYKVDSSLVFDAYKNIASLFE